MVFWNISSIQTAALRLLISVHEQNLTITLLLSQKLKLFTFND